MELKLRNYELKIKRENIYITPSLVSKEVLFTTKVVLREERVIARS